MSIHSRSFDIPSVLYIFGAGGHGREVAWIARTIRPDVRLVFLVDEEQYLEDAAAVGEARLLTDVTLDATCGYVVAIGHPGLRQRASDALAATGARGVSLVHPKAEVAASANVGEGAVIAAGSVVSVDTTISEHALVNVGCTVSHDSILGPYATLSPGTHIAGNVVVGALAFIGAGAVVINGTHGAPLVIGDGATIAAGACVISSVEAGAMMAGVPARRKR